MSDLVQQGDHMMRQRKWYEAINFYSQSNRIEKDPDIMVQMAHACKEAGYYRRAEKYYLQANGLMPNNVDLNIQLGHFYKILGQFTKSVEWYSSAIHLADLENN